MNYLKKASLAAIVAVLLFAILFPGAASMLAGDIWSIASGGRDMGETAWHKLAIGGFTFVILALLCLREANKDWDESIEKMSDKDLVSILKRYRK
jgi:hypothetical protein